MACIVRARLFETDGNMGDHQIEFQPFGRRGWSAAGETLLGCAQGLGVELAGICGGRGKCKRCRVKLVEGKLSEATSADREAFSEEELESGWRLACQAYPQKDSVVVVPPGSLSMQQRLQVEGRDVEVPLESPVESFACKLEPPSLARPVADAENLIGEISASGPAFEGYQIKDGVRAAPGAIEKVYLGDGGVSYKTIDDAEPIGICGSGILGGVSQLYLSGILDKGGRFREGSHPRVVKKNGRLEFILVPKEKCGNRREISITQKDVREIQLGKAAIQAGIETLLQAEGITEKEISKVIIAGAFGSYIDILNAIAIGMLPSLPLNRFQQAGNAAGTGARLFLLSSAKRKAVRALLGRVNYLELAGTPEFGKAFTRACLLGPFYLHPSDE
jgi:uncharacterized 2Fe-2S/4Fe-4S cluster protein (DUF4445 family)